MTVELADGVPGLQVREAEANEDVRAADDEDGQVQEVEEEREAGRERGHDEDRREDEPLESSQHRGRSVGPGVRRR